MGTSPNGHGVVVAAVEPLVRLGIAAALEGHFSVVHAVGTARAVQETLARSALRLAVLVLDPPLPDATFEEACLTLIARQPGTAVLVLLRRPAPTQVRLACWNGALGVFEVGIESERLRLALTQLSEGDVAIDPSFTRHLMTDPLAPADASGRHRRLTAHQLEALRMLADGHTTKEIARALGTSPDAVDHAIERATRQLGAAHRAQAVATAIRSGLLV